MGRWPRRLLWTLALLLVVGAPGYYALALHSPASGTAFPLDIAQVRKLAASAPGDRAVEIRVEHVMTLTFVEAMIMAGEPWRKSPMPIYSYQLVFPGSTIVLDTALDRGTAQPAFLVSRFDDDAYARMVAAMERASQIVVTHEHMDHIGGVAAHPRLAALHRSLRLTPEQLGNPDGMKPAVLPAGAMQGYRPFDYGAMATIAPGVVLIKSPGHTPGSQMVYVQLADGRELLFLGDVSWRLRNVELERERPLFMTLMIGEDRHAVLGQFAALHRLMQDEPRIRLVPGHDGPAIEALVADAYLVTRFRD